MRCPAGSLRNLNFPFAVTSRAPGQDRRSVDPKNRPPPIARGAVSRKYIFARGGAVAFTFSPFRETAHGRRAIRIVTMIRVPRRVAVLGTVFTRRVPRASARQQSCAGAGGPRDGTSFLKSDSTSCVVSGSRGVGTLGDYGAYFNRAEKSVSLRATNLFRNLLWHALGTVTCPPLLSPAIESSCSHANRVMLRSVAKPLLESPLKRVHHKTQYP